MSEQSQDPNHGTPDKDKFDKLLGKALDRQEQASKEALVDSAAKGLEIRSQLYTDLNRLLDERADDIKRLEAITSFKSDLLENTVPWELPAPFTQVDEVGCKSGILLFEAERDLRDGTYRKPWEQFVTIAIDAESGLHIRIHGREIPNDAEHRLNDGVIDESVYDELTQMVLGGGEKTTHDTVNGVPSVSHVIETISANINN